MKFNHQRENYWHNQTITEHMIPTKLLINESTSSNITGYRKTEWTKHVKSYISNTIHVTAKFKKMYTVDCKSLLRVIKCSYKINSNVYNSVKGTTSCIFPIFYILFVTLLPTPGTRNIADFTEGGSHSVKCHQSLFSCFLLQFRSFSSCNKSTHFLRVEVAEPISQGW
jgi:hypothetical protein